MLSLQFQWLYGAKGRMVNIWAKPDTTGGTRHKISKSKWDVLS